LLNANKRPIIYLICLMPFLPSLSHAQSSDSLFANRPLSSINVGLLGDASYLSFSYELVLYNHPYYFFTAELGIGYNRAGNICLPLFCSSKETVLTVPAHFTANFGDGKHFLEVGFGVTRFFGDSNYDFLGYPQLGYRYMPTEPYNPNFKFFFQLAHLFGVHPVDAYFSYIGLSIGFSF